MRVVEHRRHSRRDPGGVHLNAEGLAIARKVAPGIGRFDRVVSSPSPRAVETAEAVSHPPDTVRPELAPVPPEIDALLEAAGPRSYADYVRLAQREAIAAKYARRVARVLQEEVERTPDPGRLLVISHGHVIEFSAAAACPREALGFGSLPRFLEGVRLFRDGREWVRGEPIHLPP